MHNLPFDLLLIVLLSAVVIAEKSVRAFIKDLVTVGQDNWTWTTRSGEWFEDVEVEEIEAGEIVFTHRFGICRVAIDGLSEPSRQLLFRTRKWSEYVSSGPSRDKVSSFVAEISHAQAA
jgi:hypothetical protein